jgi:hypothetical protein
MDQHEGPTNGHDPAEQSPRELFEEISRIALCMSYDLIDKLRYWEKEVASLPDDEIDKRIPHLSALLDRLKTAYVEFSELGF